MSHKNEWAEIRNDGWNEEMSQHSHMYTDTSKGKMMSANHMGMQSSMQMMSGGLLQTLQECAAMCEHMHTIAISKTDLANRGRQLQTLHDCAEMCRMCASYMARHSPLSRKMAKLCAKACVMCGQECLRFPDKESQNCGHMCMNCAEECQRFASQVS